MPQRSEGSQAPAAAATPTASASCMIGHGPGARRPWRPVRVPRHASRTSAISWSCAAASRAPARPGCWIDARHCRRRAVEQQSEQGFFAGRRSAGRSATGCGSQLAAKTIEFEDLYRFPPVLGELDMHLLARERICQLREARRAPGRDRRRRGRRLRGLGAECAAGQRGRRLQRLGRPAPPDAQARRGRRVGALRARPRHGGSSTNTRSRARTASLLPLKADPLSLQAGTAAAHRLGRAWRCRELAGRDRPWMTGARANAARRRRSRSTRCHLGSWRGVPEEGNRYLTYRELADQLVPYVSDLGFTHLELLPITEYPFDGSWGYQPIALFAPTCRFGTPDDFPRFVDACHQAGIGVLLDWVPGHFPTDAHGLGYFDGTALYEHADPAPGPAPRLGHADLQLRPPRGGEFPARQRAVLAGRATTSTACGSMRSPRCCTSTTAARPASGSRTATAATRTSRRSPSCGG